MLLAYTPGSGHDRGGRVMVTRRNLLQGALAVAAPVGLSALLARPMPARADSAESGDSRGARDHRRHDRHHGKHHHGHKHDRHS
jgi:hypothetical protein